MSTRAKMSLADFALALRDEQLQARIVHYKADLETSPELDAVTAKVVAELQAMQRAANVEPASAPPARGGDRECPCGGAVVRPIGPARPRIAGAPP